MYNAAVSPEIPDPTITTFMSSTLFSVALYQKSRPAAHLADGLELVQDCRLMVSLSEENRMKIRKATMEDREGVINLLRTLLIPAGEVSESWRDEAQIFRLLVEKPTSPGRKRSASRHQTVLNQRGRER
jgi:hypothetical protein